MNRLSQAGILLVLAVLAGCSSDVEIQRVTMAVAERTMPSMVEPPVSPRYAALEAADAPVMTVQDMEEGTTMVLRRLIVSEGVATWISSNDRGFSFRQGVLVETRGVGVGLQASDVSELLFLLRTGQGGQVMRFESYLRGQNQIVQHSYVCDVSVVEAGQGRRRVTEDCKGAEDGFVNTYWLGAGGIDVTRSEQYPGARTQPFIFSP